MQISENCKIITRSNFGFEMARQQPIIFIASIVECMIAATFAAAAFGGCGFILHERILQAADKAHIVLKLYLK